MAAKVTYSEFYNELKTSLPTSNLEQRKIWINRIVDEDIQLQELSDLLKCEPKIATRFLWFISEIGLINPTQLLKELPYLLEFSNQINPTYKPSLASYWRIAGVPVENEGQAIDLLFQWILSTEVNITLKSRAILVLFKLSKKYPEIKNELIVCLNDQMNKYSKDFRKRTMKVLEMLEK